MLPSHCVVDVGGTTIESHREMDGVVEIDGYLLPRRYGAHNRTHDSSLLRPLLILLLLRQPGHGHGGAWNGSDIVGNSVVWEGDRCVCGHHRSDGSVIAVGVHRMESCHSKNIREVFASLSRCLLIRILNCRWVLTQGKLRRFELAGDQFLGAIELPLPKRCV